MEVLILASMDGEMLAACLCIPMISENFRKMIVKYRARKAEFVLLFFCQWVVWIRSELVTCEG